MGMEKTGFRAACPPSKRHYTFAVAAAVNHGQRAANAAHQAPNVLIFRLFLLPSSIG